jgi:hypothetical protein
LPLWYTKVAISRIDFHVIAILVPITGDFRDVQLFAAFFDEVTFFARPLDIFFLVVFLVVRPNFRLDSNFWRLPPLLLPILLQSRSEAESPVHLPR